MRKSQLSRTVFVFCRGLADLREGIIRTPLAPKETFLDGELRWKLVILWFALQRQGGSTGTPLAPRRRSWTARQSVRLGTAG